ncbi:hypothetical protein ROS1_14450 [Roseibium sp. ROS1]
MQQSLGEIADGSISAIEGNPGQADIGNILGTDQLTTAALVDEPCSARNPDNQCARGKTQIGDRIGAGRQEQRATTLNGTIDGILELSGLVICRVGKKTKIL